MNKELKVLEKNVLKAYQEGTTETKKTLSNLFPEIDKDIDLPIRESKTISIYENWARGNKITYPQIFLTVVPAGGFFLGKENDDISFEIRIISGERFLVPIRNKKE